jgi:hypothetical protein
MKALADSEVRASTRKYIAPAAIARMYFAADDKESGFLWLERAYKEHDGNLELIEHEPFIAPYRSDPRYADLLRRIGLPPH